MPSTDMEDPSSPARTLKKLREVAGDCGDRKLMGQQGGSNIHPRTLDDVR